MAIVPGEQTVDIRVADDGTGVAPEAVDTLFQRFVRLARLDGLGGAGLGLPIARDLARLHGGSLGYSEGMFVLHLRAQPTAPDPVPPGYGRNWGAQLQEDVRNGGHTCP